VFQLGTAEDPRCYAAPQPHPLMKSYRARCDGGETSGWNGGPWRLQRQAHGLRVNAAESGQLKIWGFPARPAVSRTRQVTSPFKSKLEQKEDPDMGKGWYEYSFVESWGRRLLIGIWAVPWTLRFAFCAVPCSSGIILTSYMPALYLSGCCFSSPVSALAARFDDAR
jgi:hypothetical protein